MSSFSNNTNVDTFLLETLLDRLQLRAPVNNPSITESLEEFLYRDLCEHDEDDDTEILPYQDGKDELLKEERRLEREVIKAIVSGKGDTLKPNSGQAVSIRDHSICVGCQEEDDYLVWEWHGHIMAYTDEYGYSPEYIYGSYFQRMKPRQNPDVEKEEEEEEEEEEEKGSQGLRDLIDDNTEENSGAAAARILHRNVVNAASTRI